ncbi:MAG: hypothetical protein AB2693_17160, partial [Candidatus Thiodiazotropha sp.]
MELPKNITVPFTSSNRQICQSAWPLKGLTKFVTLQPRCVDEYKCPHFKSSQIQHFVTISEKKKQHFFEISNLDEQN